MATMNISLNDELKQFVDEQVAVGSFASTSEYLRQLIREQRDLARLRALIEDGLNSGPGAPADDAFFRRLRDRAATDVDA